MRKLERIEALDRVNQYYAGGISVNQSDSHFQFVNWLYDRGDFVGKEKDNGDELSKSFDTRKP